MISEKKGHYTVGKLSKIVSKISRGNVAFELGAELQKILTFTLKRKKKKFKMILKPLPGGSVFFDFLKLKIKINKKKKFFLMTSSISVLLILGVSQKFKRTFNLKFDFGGCSVR